MRKSSFLNRAPSHRGARALLAVLVGWLVAASSAAAETPTGEPRQQKLFTAGTNGYHTYRIPALAITPRRTLLAFCEGRKNGAGDSGNIDLLLRRSLDYGKSWEPTQVLVDDGDNTCGNPCPIVDRQTGTIVLLVTKNVGAASGRQIRRAAAPPRSVWVTTSRDDGQTWSQLVDISAQVRQPDWRWYATGPCHGIQLADGRMVAPCDHATGDQERDMHSHVIYSDDCGATWQIGGVQPGGTDESSVVELADGSLYLNMRNYRGGNHRVSSVSHDRGKTWSPLVAEEVLVEPICQASILRYGGGPGEAECRVLFSNPASKRRENLTLRVSDDQCRSWPFSRTLWSGPAAYSDLVVTTDGAIGCLFEAGAKKPYETITFAIVPLDWLTADAARR